MPTSCTSLAKHEKEIVFERQEIMSGKLDLRAPYAVRIDQDVVLDVSIEGARAGSLVTVEVQQQKGTAPQAPTQAQVVRAHADGTCSASFTFKFAAKGTVTLLATAYDKVGTYFDPNAESLEVR